MNVFKTGLGLVVLSAVLAGCSSTSTPADTGNTGPVEDTNTSVDVGTTTGGGIVEDDDEVVALETIFYFDFDQSTIKPEVRALLTAHAAKLKASPRSIRLEGHADERGTREYNIALGERRANAVRDFLILQGVDASLIETISYGEEKPVALGHDDQAWSLNRRVELK